MKGVVLFAICVCFTVCSMPVSAQLAGRPTRPQVQPPQGAVRQVIFKNCVSCHGIDDYAFFALDNAGWKSLIETKHKDVKVGIADADRELLVGWLVTKFGPGTKPFPGTCVAPEITTFFSDAEAQAVLNRSCSTACHTLDRVNDARFSPDRWRVVTVDMQERAARG